MTKLATKLACATVCLFLLGVGSRSEAASPGGQEEALSGQQIAKIKELIHDTVEPALDIINRKIDALVGVVEANQLRTGRGGQVHEIADYKAPNNDEHGREYNNNHEDDNNKDEHEHKYIEKKYIYYIYCCHPYHCCKPRYCRPRCDDCDRPRCYKPHNHYCRRGDDP